MDFMTALLGLTDLCIRTGVSISTAMYLQMWYRRRCKCLMAHLDLHHQLLSPVRAASPLQNRSIREARFDAYTLRLLVRVASMVFIDLFVMYPTVQVSFLFQ